MIFVQIAKIKQFAAFNVLTLQYAEAQNNIIKF